MNLLDMERNEALKVLLTWLMGACISVGVVLGWASIQAMLLKRLGVEFLPYTYIGMGVLGMMGSSVYLMFADAVRRDKLLVNFAFGLALVLLVARMLITGRPLDQGVLTWKPVLFFLMVFGTLIISTSIVTGQLWTIINDVFRPGQGRWIYPLLHSSWAVGGILGGILVQLLTPLIGTPNLVIVWALSYFMVVLLTLLFRSRYGGELRGITRHIPGKTRKPGIFENMKSGCRFACESMYLKLLSLLTILYWVVTGLLDFQFSRIMDVTFPSEESLSRFYGCYAIGLNSAILLIQTTLTGRIIRMIGPSRGLAIMPLTGFMGFGLIMVSFSFMPGLIMRSSWDIVGQTVRGSSFQLILNAAPGELRGRVRGFLDGVINPLSGVLSGSMILLMRRVVPLEGTMSGLDLVTIMGLVLCIAWFFVAQMARKQYFLAVIANLGSRDRQTFLDSIELLEERGNPDVFRRLVEIARCKDKDASMVALSTLSRLGKLPALRAISWIMNREDEDLRASAVRAAAGFDGIRRRPQLKSYLIRRMERIFMQDPSASVRAEAVRFLMKYRSREEMSRRVREMLEHPDPVVRCKVIKTLADLKVDFPDVSLQSMIKDTVPAVRATAVEALWNIPERRMEARGALNSLFDSESCGENVAALKVAVRLGASEYLPRIESLLGSPVSCVRTLAAQAYLAFGEEEAPIWEQAVEILTAALCDPARAEEMRNDVLPLLPHLKCSGLDAVIIGVTMLPPETQRHAAVLLQDLHGILKRHLAGLQ